MIFIQEQKKFWFPARSRFSHSALLIQFKNLDFFCCWSNLYCNEHVVSSSDREPSRGTLLGIRSACIRSWHTAVQLLSNRKGITSKWMCSTIGGNKTLKLRNQKLNHTHLIINKKYDYIQRYELQKNIQRRIRNESLKKNSWKSKLQRDPLRDWTPSFDFCKYINFDREEGQYPAVTQQTLRINSILVQAWLLAL